eukprot:CAMPEP_0173109340 /NCGR_PEP_ID=MMETSP1102-20130122/43404_1 /TAXON_ID=49646 /ORGANISM="Geminigera sp., Strain Caron Lab Isolate" /LENGTH=121 /DNA_ID=CAMNT_0014008281 /DNA_START=164 /DNA_END=527 /DNA_ORIENTATION=-
MMCTSAASQADASSEVSRSSGACVPVWQVAFVGQQLQEAVVKLIHIRIRVNTLLTLLDTPLQDALQRDGGGGSDAGAEGEGNGGVREHLLSEGNVMLSDLADVLALLGEAQATHEVAGSPG